MIRLSGGVLEFSIVLWLAIPAAHVGAAEAVANWSAEYPVCKQHSELLKHGPLSVGVRISTTNPMLADQFVEAMDFWAKVLVLKWHRESSRNCAMELADGERILFASAPENMVARAQFPDRRDFQGWIVFNPAVTLTSAELYRISVHEIGHMLGLRHNSSAKSLMYGMDLDDSETLDSSDLAALAAHHKLRLSPLTQSITLAQFK